MKKILFFPSLTVAAGLSAMAGNSATMKSSSTVNVTTDQSQGELTNKKSSAKYNFTLLSFFKENKENRTDTVKTETRTGRKTERIQD